MMPKYCPKFDMFILLEFASIESSYREPRILYVEAFSLRLTARAVEGVRILG